MKLSMAHFAALWVAAFGICLAGVGLAHAESNDGSITPAGEMVLAYLGPAESTYLSGIVFAQQPGNLLERAAADNSSSAPEHPYFSENWTLNVTH